jgi:hypothetical protein
VELKSLANENKNETYFDCLLEVYVYASGSNNLFYTFILYLPLCIAYNSIQKPLWLLPFPRIAGLDWKKTY